MQSIDLSIIIPTFRREDCLLAAIRSVLPLSALSCEIIVMDDSPEGSAREAVTSIDDPRVRYVHPQQSSKGHPAIVRNEAARRYAQGRFLYFLDDDDRVHPGTLTELVNTLDRSGKGVGIAAVKPWGPEKSRVVMDEEDHFHGARLFMMKEGRFRPFLLASLLFGMPSLTCGACLVRRSLFEDIDGFSSTLPLYEDLDFYIRAIRRGGHIFLNKVLLYRRTGLPSLINDSYSAPARGAACYREINQGYRQRQGHWEFIALRVLAALSRRSRPKWPSLTHLLQQRAALGSECLELR